MSCIIIVMAMATENISFVQKTSVTFSLIDFVIDYVHMYRKINFLNYLYRLNLINSI